MSVVSIDQSSLSMCDTVAIGIQSGMLAMLVLSCGMQCNAIKYRYEYNTLYVLDCIILASGVSVLRWAHHHQSKNQKIIHHQSPFCVLNASVSIVIM
jgi:hypothetical protein